MRIVALSLLVLWTLTLAGCQSKAAKVKQLQDQYNAEYPAYAKDCLEEDNCRSHKTSDRREADQGADGGLSKPRRKNETHGASHRPTVLRSSRKRFLLHSSKAVPL